MLPIWLYRNDATSLLKSLLQSFVKQKDTACCYHMTLIRSAFANKRESSPPSKLIILVFQQAAALVAIESEHPHLIF